MTELVAIVLARPGYGHTVVSFRRPSRTQKPDVKLFGFCIVALLWTVVATSLAFAGHPLIVDDATIVDVKTCQFESWMDRDSKSSTFWILPACNFTGNLELTVGGAWTHKAGSTRNTEVALQGKTIFKSLDSKWLGPGISSRHAVASKGQLESPDL